MSWCGHGKRFACTRAMPIAVKTSSREIHQNIIREFTSSNVYCIFILTEVHTMYSVQGDNISNERKVCAPMAMPREW